MEVAQRSEAYGLVLRSQGNFSVRIPGSNRILITPTGRPYSRMRPGDLVEVDLEGRVLRAPFPASYELPVHLEAYRSDPRIGACAHTEPPYVNALYALNKALPNILGNFIYAFAGRGLAVGPRMKSGTQAFARANLAAMGHRFGIVWPNHGLFCVGRNLEVAFIRSLHAEQAAQVYYLAIGLNGREPLLLPNEEQEQFVRSARADGWDAP